jgi:hypothetical protein
MFNRLNRFLNGWIVGFLRTSSLMRKSKSWAIQPDTATARLVLSVLIVAITALSACGAVSKTADSTNIPWTDTPGQKATQPQAVTARRPCKATDLDFKIGVIGAYQGHATQEFRLTNIALDPCYLAGVPTIQLLPDGASAEAVDAGSFMATRLDIGSGRTAMLVLGAPGACASAGGPNSKVIKRLSLEPSGGGYLTVQGVYLDITCGAASVILFQAMDSAVTNGGPLTHLVGTISAPDLIKVGQLLNYTVTLMNPTTAALPLQPCPSYTESLQDAGIVSSQTYQLNCVAAALPAQGSLTFDMQILVPANFPTGFAKLSWQLEVPGGIAVGKALGLQ